MQNKGLVRILAVCLALAAAFCLSFSFVTRHYDKKAEVYSEGDPIKKQQFEDSIASKSVWFGYTLKECRQKEINLGLDLKGGMNVIMEVSVPDILRSLSGHNTSENFNAAMARAAEKQKTSSTDFVTLFIESFYEVAGQDAKLSTVFATFELKDKVNLNTSNADVERIIREEVDGAIANSFNVLRTRIDRFGVVQPNIQKLDQPGRILIELPGIKEPERVRKLLQGSANLEFWRTFEAEEVMSAMVRINNELAKSNAAEEPAAEEAAPAEAKAEAGDEFDALVEGLQADSAAADEAAIRERQRRENPLFSLLSPSVSADGRAYRGPVVGMAHYSDTAKINAIMASPIARQVLDRDLRLRWTVKAVDEAGSYFQLIALRAEYDGRAALEGDVITDARAEFSQFSSAAEVSMAMNAEGANKWKNLTGTNIGRSVAIVLDGYVYSFPTVQSEIAGGRSQITGHFTLDEAKDLANTLKSGKMPAPARIVQEDIVGPSLGQESIRMGLISFIIAFCLILLYMIAYYGLIPGLIADAALLCNVFLLLGILASFGSVLTLPGIAGIVLTMGTAVDANVLIFERIREEMRLGKGMRKAVEDGYKGAISAIVDANVTSLLTGIVLAVFGTGPIKGFAVTFIIGIISSFLTAVFLARLFLERYVNSKNAKELQFTTDITKNWFQNTHINFIGSRFIAYAISGTLIVVGIVGLITPGLNRGIDFTGGRNYVIRFDQKVNIQEVEKLVTDAFEATEPEESFSVRVITIGDENQVRISTNYGLSSDDENLDALIENVLYESTKGLLQQEVSREEFLSTQLNENVGIMSSQKVGPSIADDIKEAAVWSVIIALIIIALYIFIRFRNISFSIAAIVSLAHDTLIIMGVYALFWKLMPFSMEVDQSFIAAILTVIGYSINDTVVIFDRVREYRTLYPKRDMMENMNNALNSTLSRTFSTSLSTGLVLLAIFLFGGPSIQGFVFALLLGVLVGTYSSLYIAAPVAFGIQRLMGKK
ncbi:MAG: protein translocase subunit SecDF [Paludibacteraceae bacterium]|nr:protein translocase subunit SecDF [Paludibacteraceae bacterium]MBR1480886.1 protein translocase subunit SecDF [Paludibacteraceae bacterium]